MPTQENSDYREINKDWLINYLERWFIERKLPVSEMFKARDILMRRISRMDLSDHLLSSEEIKKIIERDGGVLDQYFKEETKRRGTTTWYVGDKEIRSRSDLEKALKPFFPWGLNSEG